MRGVDSMLRKVPRSIPDSMRSQQEKPSEVPRREIQGPRPAPLKICRASHGVRKPAVPIAADRVQPVIIYTHSPKIIHTEAQDFMTLVQRLTGSSHTRSRTRKPKHCSAAAESAAPSRDSNSCNYDQISRGDVPIWPPPSDSANPGSSSAVPEPENSSSAVNRSSQHGTASAVAAISGGGLIPPPSPNSPNYGLVSPSIFQDLPLFTPISDNFFYSPRHFYRFSEPIFTPPQRPPHSSLISPSPAALDLYKTLPEYQ